jgi:hypothetical protein
MKYALAVAALLAASSAAYAGGPNAFIAGFGQGFMQSQQPYAPQYAPQYDSSIPPIPSIPPIGASSCQPFRMCDATGRQCGWQQVCH